MAELTLLDKAIAYNKNATMLLTHRMDDECFLSLCCFNMQQAHEMLLKYLLEYFNIDYKRTHDIDYLISTLETQVPVFCTELKDIADTLTDWESKSRYASNFLGTVREVERSQHVFSLMLNELEFNHLCINTEDYNYCYQYIKSQGYKYQSDIIKCSEDIVANHLIRPFNQNAYSLIRSKLPEYFNQSNGDSSKTNYFT